MDGLDSVIQRAEAFDAEASEVPDFEAAPPVGSVQSGGAEAAENMAVSLLKTAEAAAKLFIDPRLCLDDDELQSGRESLAPAIDKHGLAVGTGRMPYQEEIAAGFYLGGLFRRFRRTWAELKAADKAKQAKREAENGSKREYEAKEPARAIPGDERIREEPNADKEGWNSEGWGAGGAVGHEPGPPGA